MSTRIAFIYLHAGENHILSKQYLDVLSKANVDNMIIPIEYNDTYTKELIQNNTKGIAITELPVFILCGDNIETRLFKPEEIDDVFEILKSIQD